MSEIKIYTGNANKAHSASSEYTTVSVGQTYTTKNGKVYEVRAIITSQWVGSTYVDDSIQLAPVATEAGIITNKYSTAQFLNRFLFDSDYAKTRFIN